VSRSSDLVAALGRGDPNEVAALIAAGADVCYRRDKGYDALLDAVHGRDVARDPRLLDLLTLLIAHGADLHGVSEYQESAVRVLSRLGRFDAVRLLLDAGADRDHLGWTPLMDAVAFGSLDDVRDRLARHPPLEETDWWSRTAWLIAILAGDIGKADLLLDHGASGSARGRCGTPAPFFAIDGHHPDTLQWLLEAGADVDDTDDFGITPLMHAVEIDDAGCAAVLLAHGAEIERYCNGTALNRARSQPVVRLLLDAGADPAHLSHEGRRAAARLPPEPDPALVTASRDDFRRACARRFGAANPERMDEPFWISQIRSGISGYDAGRMFDPSLGASRDPIWCAQRFGQSLTFLDDGRVVLIAGEHEDFYDPDFCIYNDVFVIGADGSIAIFGYPESIFPPTDFHTATLVGGHIYVIGSLGYRRARRPGDTPLVRLDVQTFEMERLDARGEHPGWIHGHRAVRAGPGEIRVWGGEVFTTRDGKAASDVNADSFLLDLDRLRWRREPA
jgi:ankyrin repeat protein